MSLLKESVTMNYDQLMISQTEIVAAIEESGIHELFGYKNASEYFIQHLLLPKTPKPSKKQTSLLHKPLVEFVSNNLELITETYTTNIAKNKKPDMWKAEFGTIVNVQLPAAIEITKPVTNEKTVCSTLKIECRFFATPA